MGHIRIKQLLESALEELDLVIQWSEPPFFDFASGARYMARAEAIIELVEVWDCGSTGGYSDGQPETNNLFERWLWLAKKYTKIKPKAYKDAQNFFAVK